MLGDDRLARCRSDLAVKVARPGIRGANWYPRVTSLTLAGGLFEPHVRQIEIVLRRVDVTYEHYEYSGFSRTFEELRQFVCHHLGLRNVATFTRDEALGCNEIVLHIHDYKSCVPR